MAIRALVVDDEKDILRLIEIKLKKAGFEIVTAHDGQEGLEKALAEKPDIMLVDVMMPRMDGYTVVSEVRQQLGSEAPVIILLTAKGQEADVVKGLTSGADDYIIKPFSPRELIARINVVLIKSGKHANIAITEMP
jgi:two-component system, OmpR family, alkaline phosphatase synthesis response regulator PhoP